LRKLALVFALSITAVAQTDVSQLTATEKFALSGIIKESQEAQQATQKAQNDFAAFVADVAATHPGYRFNPQTGSLEKLPAPPAPEKPKTDKK